MCLINGKEFWRSLNVSGQIRLYSLLRRIVADERIGAFRTWVAEIGSCDSLTTLGMKLNRSVRALLLAACGIGVGGGQFSFAADKADKIELPGDKTQRIPIKERGYEIPSLFDSPLRMPSSGPLFRMPGTDGSTKTIDPKTQRRLQDQQYEKDNWMFLGRGQLKERREREEGVLGDKWEKERLNRPLSRTEIMFNSESYTKDDSAKAAKIPVVKRAAEAEDLNPDRRTADSLSLFNPGSKADRSENLHSEKALDFKNLLQGGETKSGSVGGKLTLGDLLSPGGGGSERENSREQQNRQKEFQSWLNTSRFSPPPASAGDPINGQSDFTRSSLNPIISRSAGSPGFMKDTLPKTDFARPPVAPSAPSSFGPVGVHNPGLMGWSGMSAPTFRPSQPQNSAFQSSSLEAPRRKF